MTKTLQIKDLHASIGEVKILNGIDLALPAGEVHAIMGPNGSGKSTLANVLMGRPDYTVTKGEVYYGEDNLLELDPDERARQGVFLAFQYPYEIPGVRVQDFLRTSMLAVHPDRTSLADFADLLDDTLELLKMDRSYLTRSLNEGFSGGEKKRAEILQMIILDPTLAILDETDSGLDVDALKIVAEVVNSLRREDFSALVITHYQRILNYLIPDKVHILHKGRIVKTGGEMIRKVTLTETTWNDLPYKFEAGTPNIAGAVGLGVAIDYLESIGMDNIHEYVQELTAKAYDALAGIEGLKIFGPRNARTGALSFTLDGVHPHDLATILDSDGIAVRAGHHCAEPLMDWLQTPATCRASFYAYNTPGEIEALVAGIEKAKDIMKV